jgi:MFS family permease
VAVGRRGSAITAFLGTTLEFYDFFIFGAAAATVFPELFYPGLGRTGELLATMVAYGIGYADRPLGAFLFRRFGRGMTDRRLLITATVLVGVATTAIGCLPTYQTIGATAGVLLMVLRAVQGIGLGGEWGRATLAMPDEMPNDRPSGGASEKGNDRPGGKASSSPGDRASGGPSGKASGGPSDRASGKRNGGYGDTPSEQGSDRLAQGSGGLGERRPGAGDTPSGRGSRRPSDRPGNQGSSESGNWASDWPDGKASGVPGSRASDKVGGGPSRTHRGPLASLVQLGSPLGLLAGNAMFAIAAAIAPRDAYLQWGWRVPFVASGVLIVVLLAIRLRFLPAPSPQPARTGLMAFCRLHWRQLLIAVAVRTSSDAAFYVMALYVLGYVSRHLGLPKQVGFTAVILGAVAEIAGIPLFGALAARVRRKWIVVFEALASAGWAFVYFGLLDSGTPVLIYLATAVGVFLNAAMWSPARVFVTELFPPGVRDAGTGLGFQLSAVLGGGLTPLVAAALVAASGSGVPVAWYVAVLLAIGAAAAALVR